MTTSAQANPVNADAAELAKFSALASRWWDPESEFKPLHAINPLRLEWISQVANGLGNKTVLDVGCGGGILAESMAAHGAVVTGIDLAEKSLKVAKLHSLETGIKVEYRNISVEQMAADHPASFDIVTCMELLEHVPDPESVIRACAALVKPGGLVFFSTLNRNLKSFAFAILGAEYILGLVPKGTHSYEHFIRPSELLGAARQAGLDAVAIKGLEYNPLTKIYRLSGDSSVNYLVATTRI
ncbi:Ubiquinone biosynthesis O-methyltransferase [Pigmentiphaga humi]|uniref:Ubiquinone biosynthesis O-methyltransferase n=1 Tax=Pigmentiphaga humi TaxID=2478468 RepID=A0A3P4AYA0_9BURK|nr:bifunctional 2-polyprenyl-6-hydroxyphenol methylase/3-demethylubiquinol 3-O-methyltransferase UbiG [Pigmentiphaga humi]VCU69017.1 Ubiquinone biosynthesis O-methyltransferase [Pigmentiphaga humi]